jgi:hypothetical protein
MKWFVPNGIYYSSEYDIAPERSLARLYFEQKRLRTSSRIINGSAWGIEGEIYEGAVAINEDEVLVLLSGR